MDLPDSTRTTRLGALLVALLVALSAGGPAAAIPQPDGTIGMEQTPAETTVAPDTTVEVEATINATGYNGPAMDVDLPDGWSIVDQSATGPATYKSSTNEWIWLQGGEYTVSYTVQVPDGASGEYAIDATGSAIDPADDSFAESSASTSVTVQAQPANEPPTADAGSDQTVDEETSVTLDASGSDDPDAGDTLTYSWTQTGGPTVSLSDSTVAQPTFTAPDVDGDATMTFQVTVDDGQATDTDSVDVTVSDLDGPGAPDGVSLSQAVPAGTTVGPGDVVTVEATVSAAGLNAPALDVDLPDGWTISSQSATGPATYKPSTNEWVWTAGGGHTVSYTVQVPDGASGEYTIDASASAIVPATDESVSDTAPLGLTVTDQQIGAPATEVVLSPTDGETVVGTAQTYDVVVENADGGVGAFEATVSVADGDVAEITAAGVHDSAGSETSDTAVDGTGATLMAALMDTDDTGSVTIGSVTVEGVDPGTTDLTVDVPKLGTELGAAYEVTGTEDASITVIEIGPVGNFAQPPTDPDGDGVYEDVNGDGSFDILDIQALFAHLQDPTVTDNPAQFDINGDESIDVVDAQALYSELTT